MSKPIVRTTILESTRWNEIRFFYFCMGVYNRNNDLLEVTAIIETIASMCKLEMLQTRNLAVKVLTDPKYTPNKLELLYLCRNVGNYSFTDISKFFKMTRRNAIYQVKAMEETKDFTVYAHHTFEEQQQINEMLVVIEYMRGCIL